MKEMQGKQIDEFFRKGLADPDIPFQEEHWYVLQEELEKRRKRKRVIAWWTRAGGIAAMLIMGLLVWDYQKGDNPNKSLKTVKNKPVTTEQSIAQSKEQAPVKSQLPFSEQTGNRLLSANKRGITKPVRSQQKPFLVVENPAADIIRTDNIIPEISIPKVQPVVSSEQSYIPLLTNMVNLANTSSKNSFVTTGNIQSGSKPAVSLSFSATSDINRYRPENSESGFKPSLTLSFIAAPDLNGVDNFTNSRVGINGGLSATLGVSPALSISTGIAYAKKIYQTDFNYYKPNTTYIFRVTPTAVNADCRVLDIPLNVNYTVWNNNENKIQLTAGASSYIMLDEKYKYIYQDPNAKGPKAYQVKNKNKHYFGIINLAANYQKQLNNKISVGIQPYFKLPVTDIGYGNVRLKSAGVALNFNFNLFPRVQKP